ncbi:hypothetical protein [Streptomyces gibsoniae]|uniref:Uncharacterized protein n=1 Tax=Streptomyces gibsoniae TaxID=3075529 RepID=A0ABU2TV75_9ACTN|nr:hypothetical protein [Streptomyces sp. DSM 41699]MDT0464760.1 hypothetical protein [Streptomyces sp. DSM 41699]
MISSHAPTAGLPRTSLVRAADAGRPAWCGAVRPAQRRDYDALPLPSCATRPTPGPESVHPSGEPVGRVPSPSLELQPNHRGATVPEFYPSIGEAVGAAMRHNIRLAHGSETSGSDRPLRVRYLPRPSADPYSVPGMLARLTETAAPNEVAAIIEEVNGALVGALPQLIELVAAAADWTRVRLAFDDPNHNPTFETWTRLAAAHVMLQYVQEQLEFAEDGIAACPAELTDPRHHKMVNILQTRELLSNVFSTGAVVSTLAPADGGPEASRQRAARTSSPTAAAQRARSPSSSADMSASAPPTRTSRAQ